jgi:hypothetical protein
MKNLTIPQDNIFLPAILEINWQVGDRLAGIVDNNMPVHMLLPKDAGLSLAQICS